MKPIMEPMLKSNEVHNEAQIKVIFAVIIHARYVKSGAECMTAPFDSRTDVN